MKAFLVTLALCLVASLSLAQELMPDGHVHAYRGDVLISVRHDYRIVIAVKRADSALVDRMFAFRPRPADARFIHEAIPDASVNYDHKTLTVYGNGKIFFFAMTPEAVSHAAAANEVRIYNGVGLSMTEPKESWPVGFDEAEIGMVLDQQDAARQSVANPPVDLHPPFQKIPPQATPGPGCAQQCSIQCLHGIGYVGCLDGHCATCVCTENGYPLAFCSP